MGLDMFLRGDMFQWTNWKNPASDEHRCGKRITNIEVDLGYWRKHPDLHGYIIKTFAVGVDECQRIDLEEEDIEKIIEAINSDNLAHQTTGFFFGKSYQPGEKDDYSSYEDQKANDKKIFEEALCWLKESEDSIVPGTWGRSVFYRASW
jgi:hypothetical protein